MFKFGCNTIIELYDALVFDRIFGLKTDRPTFLCWCYRHLCTQATGEDQGTDSAESKWPVYSGCPVV